MNAGSRDTMLTRAELETLEGLIDRTSLSRVVEAMAHICAEKAEHVRSTWADEGLARTWERAGRACDRFSQHSAVALAGQ